MPVYAKGRVEHQKRTQTATTLLPFGFVFGVQLGSLEERKRGLAGTCRAASYVNKKTSFNLNIITFSLTSGRERWLHTIHTPAYFLEVQPTHTYLSHLDHDANVIFASFTQH